MTEGDCRTTCAWPIGTWSHHLRDDRLWGERKSTACWTTSARPSAECTWQQHAELIDEWAWRWAGSLGSDFSGLSLNWLRRSDVILRQSPLGSFLSWMRGETRANLEMKNRRSGVYAGGEDHRVEGALEKWAADNMQYSLGTCPWLVMMQDGCWAALTAWSCCPAHCSRTKHPPTHVSEWTVYPVPGPDPSSLPCCCHPDKGTPEVSSFCCWYPDFFSYEWVQLEGHCCSHTSTKSRGCTHKVVGFNERMGHSPVMKWRTHTEKHTH